VEEDRSSPVRVVDAHLHALREISSVIASEPNLQAIVNRTLGVLARIIPFGSIALLLHDEKSGLARIHALQTGSGHSGLEIGTEISLQGTGFGLAMEEQKPILIEDGQSELRKLPDLAARLKGDPIRSFYALPLSTARRRLGLLVAATVKSDAFNSEDLELMDCVASHLSIAFDSALAFESVGHLEDQRAYLESEIISESGFEDIIGRSDALRKVLEQVQIVASTDSTVIIHGETGTGKELIARAIHRSSSRSDKTFVRLNCAAIPSGLLESELFGHEKGAFTGALSQRRGRFELADRGTLFLDEIGDISIDLQPKLLRAIQEREFERIGGTRTIQVDVRLIAATHKDLRKMIREGTFREDLFYRLNVFPIEVAPLRERREDIPLLVEYFVSRLCQRMQRPMPTISRATMDALKAWDWPGNVRELENFMERAVILSTGDRLNAPLAELASSRARVTPILTFRDGERNTIIAALKASRGKIAGKDGAATLLGLKRTTLLDKMRKLNIARSEFCS